MAIVSDQFDPSGMFSKAGRVSLEMFQIIQQKNEILFNKKKYYHPKLSSPGLYDLDSLKQKGNSDPDLKEKKPGGDPKDKKPTGKAALRGTKSKLTVKKEPFSKTVSREKLNQIHSKEKLNDKRFGMYNPRFNLIFKKSPFYQYETKEEQLHTPKRKKESILIAKNHYQSLKGSKSPLRSPASVSQSSIELNTLPDLPLKPLGKVPIPIPLEKQLPRKEIFISSLNEKRFEYFDLPEISTKVRRAPKIDLSHGGRTNHNSVFASERSGLEYKPKYTLVFPKDDLMIPNFKKTVPRKDNTHVTYTLNETSLTYDEYNTEDYSPTGKKIMGPIFDKMVSREMSVNESKLSLKENSKSRSEIQIKDQKSVTKLPKILK